VLTVVLCLLCAALEILHGLGVCLSMPFVYYDQNSLKYTLWAMPLLVKEYDRRTTSALFDYFRYDMRWDDNCCGGCCCSICDDHGKSPFESCECCDIPDSDLRAVIDTLLVWDS
jgi:hypothetical protein